jgi:hypothetical protein
MALGLISKLSRSVSMAYTGAWSQGFPDNLAMYCSIVVMAFLGVPLGAHITSNIDRESLTTALIWLVFAAGLQAMGVFPPGNTVDVLVLGLALLWTVALGFHVMLSRRQGMGALAKMGEEEDATSDVNSKAGGGRRMGKIRSDLMDVVWTEEPFMMQAGAGERGRRKSVPLASLDQVKIESGGG